MGKNYLFIDSKGYSLNIEYVTKNFLSNFERIEIDYVHEYPEELEVYAGGAFWLNPIGKFNLVISHHAFGKENVKELTASLCHNFRELINPFLKVIIKVNEYMKEHRETIRPLTDVSFFIEIESNVVLCFLLDDITSSDNFRTQIEGIVSLINRVVDGDEDATKSMSDAFKPDKRSVFYMFNGEDQKWHITNLLFQLGKEKMLRVKEGHDTRFYKPHMMVNENNLTKEFTFPSNWRITNRKRGYVMDKPNDMALYASIANKALDRAVAKYKEIHKKDVTDLILSEETSSEFCDYFEEIILAIIMSYTTIECMANSCLPFFYKYTIVKDDIRTTYTKEEIERKFHLKDKLKKILPDAISVKSPIEQKWWQNLVDLQYIRDELIHSKDAKAEERYSLLIDERIWDVASCHNVIISHYAQELCKMKSPIINDFPVGVDCDEIIPGLMSEKSYENMYKSLFNPS